MSERDKDYDSRDLRDAFAAGQRYGDSQWTRGHTGVAPTFDEWFDATFPTTECDHPGIEHGRFSYTWPCPKCGVCKFIGHGPLCGDCYAAS